MDGFIASFVDPLVLAVLATTGAAHFAEAKVGIFAIGTFLSALITFIVKAAVIYVVIVAPMAAIMARRAKEPALSAPLMCICSARFAICSTSGRRPMEISVGLLTGIPISLHTCSSVSFSFHNQSAILGGEMMH